ncbi:MAG: shikimate kinase [Aestuariivirgaceae bacterium]|nr:shikimate kinase [Aestuariivirgaceae bacterium]
MARRPIAQETEIVTANLAGRSIVLVGLMGAGKSTVGRRLAQRLNLDFVDADTAIEEAAGMTIPEIFTIHGEAYFREGERRVITRILEDGQQVLATGGGAFMNEQTRAGIAAKGISIWLKADLPLLMKRVSRRADRPLLLNDDPEGVMRKLMDTRYPIYASSDVVIDSRDVSHNVIVNDVIRALSAFLEPAHLRKGQK